MAAVRRKDTERVEAGSSGNDKRTGAAVSEGSGTGNAVSPSGTRFSEGKLMGGASIREATKREYAFLVGAARHRCGSSTEAPVTRGR